MKKRENDKIRLIRLIGIVGASIWGITSILRMDIKASNEKNLIDIKLEQSGEEEIFEIQAIGPEFREIVGLPNYEEENQDRYRDYYQIYPEVDIEDVIWQVNVGLDRPYYEGVNEIDLSKGEPLIINKYNKLPEEYRPKELIALSSGPLVTPETKGAYEEMVREARELGYSIRGVSGYRSMDYQRDLYNRYLEQDSPEEVDQYSARPGYSEHHTGRAIDLDNVTSNMSNFGNTREAKWVADNAYKYGFIIRYSKENEGITGYMYEPWHITYVGIEIATDMRRQKIDTLEEYEDKYLKNEKLNIG